MPEQSERRVDARGHAARQEDGDAEWRGHAGLAGVERLGAFVDTVERGSGSCRRRRRREPTDRQ